MKSTRALIMIVVAFLLAIGAVYVASLWVRKQSTLSTNQVAVAAADIDIGTRLTREMVRITEWPATSVPQGAFPASDKLLDRVVRTGIQRGEPLLESKLAPLGSKGGLSAIVADGKRAITVRVNDVVGVAGFALPGNYVDILVNTQSDDKEKTHNQDARVSKIVLEHILVLAVAQEAGRDETKPKVVNAVTLEVSPEDAEKLDLARNVGTLALVLRNQVDPRASATTGATKATLLKTEGTAAEPQASVKPVVAKRVSHAVIDVAQVEPPRNCISVITGIKVSAECF